MHCLLEEMLLYHLLRLIKKEETNECKTNKDLSTLLVSDTGMKMKLENINYGSKSKKLL